MPRTVIAICALALVLAACGGADTGEPDTSNPTDTVASDTDTTEPSAAGEEEPPEDSGPSGLPSGGDGTVTIDGETFASAQVFNCIIDPQFSPQPRDLDLTASLDGGLDSLFITLSTQDIPMGPNSVPFVSVSADMQVRGDSGEMILYEAVIEVWSPQGRFSDGARLLDGSDRRYTQRRRRYPNRARRRTRGRPRTGTTGTQHQEHQFGPMNMRESAEHGPCLLR